MTEKKHLWAGRFSSSPVAALDAINKSIAFDRRLHDQDIRGSMAHARMLANIGVLSDRECDAILQGLSEIREEFSCGSFVIDEADEDIHMAVERRLIELVGDPGRKLHTGRSRNDQVATDVRLFAVESCILLEGLLARLIRLVVDRARDHAADPIPAYTHLQRGMPTTLGHHLLAWAEMLIRDLERFQQARARASVSPLGNGACVGTSFALDREGTASALGFPAITRNSLDGVSDRDFVLDVLFASATTAMHLSRVGEEFVLWSSQEYAFVELGDSVTTGSSMMPNKKNPDGAELLRGKAGRVFGNLVALLSTLKGLPLTYNKDMQEDKEPLFDSVDTVELGLRMSIALLEDADFQTARMRAACSGWVNATDFCEGLVRAGVPLRTAHHQTGRIVARAIERGVEIQDLAIEEVKEIAPDATEEILASIDLDSALAAKALPGGTAPEAVSEAAGALLHALDQLEDREQ